MADDKLSRIDDIRHEEATRTNIPTAEDSSLLSDEQAGPTPVGYVRARSSREHPEDYVRDQDHDPQLVWKGKDKEDETDLVVGAPPIYVQEKISARFIVENLLRFFRRLKARGPRAAGDEQPLDYKDEHDEIPDPESRVEFYKHRQRWTNRMILGDSLKVMASLAEREKMSGKVQCIFMDPPYGINYKSNWQMSTRSTEVSAKDVNQEPEVVRAFRDTWKRGIHSYLSYLRDRLQAARELLTESGSLFFQIGDENVHLCRSLMDEVFGRENYVITIKFKKGPSQGNFMNDAYDYILWFAKDKKSARYQPLFFGKKKDGVGGTAYNHIQLDDGSVVPKGCKSSRKGKKQDNPGDDDHPKKGRLCRRAPLTAPGQRKDVFSFEYNGVVYPAPRRGWMTHLEGMRRLQRADRLCGTGTPEKPGVLYHTRLFNDALVMKMESVWTDTMPGGFKTKMVYPVQTKPDVVERCILMTTQPGDLVLDPTCGSGTTAFVAEKHGRRWITIDTSKVALVGARARLMGAKFPYYILADSPEGAKEEEKISGILPTGPYNGSISRGFVYTRSSLVQLAQIAHNSEIDAIWEKHEKVLAPLLVRLNALFSTEWKEWEVPLDARECWSPEQSSAHKQYWRARLSRRAEMDKSIARASEIVLRRDLPVEDKKVVRVSGPFTVEALSPHRVVPLDEKDIEAENQGKTIFRTRGRDEAPFHEIVRDRLESEGISGTKKAEALELQSLQPLERGRHVHFIGKCRAKDSEEEYRDVAVLIGDEYGTVSREQIVQAAREVAEFSNQIQLLALGFAFEARAAGDDAGQIGRVRYRKVRMDQELRMVERLAKSKSKGSAFFTLIGEVEVDVRCVDEDDDMWVAEVRGVEVYDFNRHAMRSAEAHEIACWFLDTDYNEEAFFVKHAYFPGRRVGDVDPYESLKNALQGEVPLDEWKRLNRTVSRPFKRPESGLIAVKAINDRGDEVLTVCRVPPA